MRGWCGLRPGTLRSLVAADGQQRRGRGQCNHGCISHAKRPSMPIVTTARVKNSEQMISSTDSPIGAHAQQEKHRNTTTQPRAVSLGGGALLLLQIAALSSPEVGHAAGLLAGEPSNALSLPTWAIHTSSVIEWAIAMSLMWKYGEVSGNERWKGMTWGMLPCLGSAMCACTWHFFYNAPELEFLVALQAFLTIVGNTTCWIAAYRIYQSSVQQQ
ncbi:hypothetical protein M9434_004140 [Picochlorum sp. BPE23]|nr:hypothetical protein M9434_004140 [Picochlorum sp. BPE23]